MLLREFKAWNRTIIFVFFNIFCLFSYSGLCCWLITKVSLIHWIRIFNFYKKLYKIYFLSHEYVSIPYFFTDKTSESQFLSYEFIEICAAGGIAITMIQFQRQCRNIVQSFLSGISLFQEVIIVIINICIVHWAKGASLETSIPFNLQWIFDCTCYCL